jgi:hypothetical protein
MSRRVIVGLILFATSAWLPAIARATVVPTNQGTGQDGFAYSGSEATFPLSTFYNVLPTVKTVGAAHDTESLVQFDLSGLGLTPAQATSATLNLYVDDSSSTGFGSNPDANFPAQVDLYPLTGSWNRATLVWSNKPGTGSLISSVTITSIGHWISYDVTSQVQAWLTTPASNFGLLLRENAVVGGPGNYHVAAFDSGFGTQSANAPYLAIVPEPSTWLLALAAPPALVWARRRRKTR